jgi:hypothetical protein
MNVFSSCHHVRWWLPGLTIVLSSLIAWDPIIGNLSETVPISGRVTLYLVAAAAGCSSRHVCMQHFGIQGVLTFMTFILPKKHHPPVFSNKLLMQYTCTAAY